VIRFYFIEEGDTMKRRADENADDGGRYKQIAGSVGADASKENGSSQLGRGRRHGAYLRKMRALNEQFAGFVKSQATTRIGENPITLPMDACALEYIKYASDLQEEYSDVLDQETIVTGSLLVWGTGDMGQLGQGEDVQERPRPSPLSLNNLAVRKIACGGMHTLALTADGVVWSWGVDDEGALGREVKTSNDHIMAGMVAGPSAHCKPDNEPAIIPSISGVVDISAGDSHSVAVTSKGEVFAWGSFRDASGLWCFKPGVKIQKLPIKVFEATSDAPVVQLASGVDHIVALTANGKVYTWGCGERGRLGRLSEEETEGRQNNGE
jgi:regulator of chromosome condensation